MRAIPYLGRGGSLLAAALVLWGAQVLQAQNLGLLKQAETAVMVLGPIAKAQAEARLKAIVESADTTEAKDARLRALLAELAATPEPAVKEDAAREMAQLAASDEIDSDGDGIPDAQDQSPLVFDAVGLVWTVSSISFGWETEAAVESLEKTDDTDVKEALKSTDFSYGGGFKLYGRGETSIEAGIQAEGNLSLNLFKALRSGVQGSYRSGVSAQMGLSGSGDVDWRRTNQDRARKARTVMRAVSSRVAASRPFAEFTVEFVNSSPDDYACSDLEIPVVIGDNVVAYARCYETEAKSDFVIPARRPAGIPVRFRAALDNSQALRLLDYMENAGPSFRVERSRGRITAVGTGADAISKLQLLQLSAQSTCALNVQCPGMPPVAWRVARRSPSGPVTLQQAMEAVNARVARAIPDRLPVFKVTNGVLDSMVGIDNGSNFRWWGLRVDGRDVDLDLEGLLVGEQVTMILNESPPGVTSRYLSAIRRSAESGIATHQYYLGRCYYHGLGVAKDAAEAVKWYRLAADQGDARAQDNLGFCYKYGQGVPKDEMEAVRLYRLAAEQGHAGAQLALGACYKFGRGVAKDEKEAVKWCRLAAEQGHAAAQAVLGGSYEDGLGVAKDEEEAAKWYRLAAEQGHAAAQNNLGNCYSSGRGVAKDESEAVKWYRLAAEQGHAAAQAALGFCHGHGRGVAKDEAEAVKWYRLAAEQGDARAQNNLGSCYKYGRGVAKDEREAVRLYRLAAEQGHAAAQHNLGACYESSQGVAKDDREAVKWFRLAAEQGDEDARKALELLE